MSGPWQTPAAGSALPPRNGNVQRYETRYVYPRNSVTGATGWLPGREAVFQFESDPASGWLVPSESKLYVRGTLGTKADASKIPAHSIRFAASPLFGMLDQARYSMNGTTVQSVSGDLDTHAQLQLRLSGNRESHDTNAMLGCDSLRQKMLHPERRVGSLAGIRVGHPLLDIHPGSATEVLENDVIPNDKHKILSDRMDDVHGNSEIELASPVSLALTSWGVNKFVPGGSHDLRFTIGQEGVNMKKSIFTQRIEPCALGQSTVLSQEDATTQTVNIALPDGLHLLAAQSNGTSGLVALDNSGTGKTVGFQAQATEGGKVAVDKIYLTKIADPADAQKLKGNRNLFTNDGYSYFGTSQADGTLTADNIASRKLSRTRLLARAAPPIEAYNDAATGELQFIPSEVFLMCVYALPVYGTVPRPLSTQMTFDNIHLIQETIGKVNGSLTKQLTIPVNTTRIVITFQDGAKTLTNNRELIGQYGGLGDSTANKNGSISSLQITLGGQSLPSPAYSLNFKTGQTIVPWADWQSFLKAGINSSIGSQDRSEWESDPAFAFRIMGERSSVAQNLSVKTSFLGTGTQSDDCVMNVFCIGTNVIEAVYDDDASFQPTSVSVQEVV